MSAHPVEPRPNDVFTSDRWHFLQWFLVGAVASAIFFLVSVRVPHELKLTGIYNVGLGAAAGWALGLWGAAKHVRPSMAAAALVWLIIAGSEGLAAFEAHRVGVKPQRADLKPEQLDRDMVSQAFRDFLAQEPDDLSDEDRERRRQIQEEVDQAELRRQKIIEAQKLHRSFYGYLANRIPPQWGRWDAPWPAVFWGGEIALAGTLGTWLACRTIRKRFQDLPHGSTV